MSANGQIRAEQPLTAGQALDTAGFAAAVGKELFDKALLAEPGAFRDGLQDRAARFAQFAADLSRYAEVAEASRRWRF